MNPVRIAIVCAVVLGTAYVNEANQRNVTYFLDDVCHHYMLGTMPNENVPINGKHLREKTREWLRQMSDKPERWGGIETLREKCTTAGGKITVQGNSGIVGVMSFLEYITTVTSNEHRKVATMLFHKCGTNNRSVELWDDIKKPLCYLLYYNGSQEENAKNIAIDLCSGAIQNTSISGVMESLADFGKCLETTNLSLCTQKLGLFKGSWVGKTRRRRGKKGKGRRRGKGKGRKRVKGSRKKDRKVGRKGRRKAGRKGKKRNQNENDKQN